MKLIYVCLAALAWLSVSAGEEVPVVTTAEGKVSGVAEKAFNGDPFYSYYGIPYAAPPVGELRFKDPKVASKWHGVRECSTLPPSCTQVRFGAVLAGFKVPPENLDGQEDCLYLNVFRPKREPPKGDYPVMFFIHGGGFFAGASDEYLPHVMLSKDVILIVIQYRLGFLGFLSTEDSVMPGNYGLKDQTLALQWVQRNIRNFGGNPDKVTIFGESAGGASVHYQMLTPKAKGLFSGAIMQSGNAICPWANKHEHSKVAKKVGTIVGCDLDEGSERYLQCMQSVSEGQINAAVQDVPIWFHFPLVAVPRFDGDYIPDHPARLMQEGRYNKVNVISGVTAQEGALFSQPMYARPDLIRDISDNFAQKGPHSLDFLHNDDHHKRLTDLIYEFYLGGPNFDRDHAAGLTKMFSDHYFKVDHDHFSELHSRQKDVSTYRYELEYRGQMSVGDFVDVDVGKDWISHGDDLFYLFRGGPLLQPFEAPSEDPTDLKAKDDLHLRNIILTLWTNFAATGNPTPDESLGFSWSAMTPDNLSYLSLSPAPTMRGDARKEVREFYTSLPTEVNRILNPHLIKEFSSSTGGGTSRTKQDEL